MSPEMKEIAFPSVWNRYAEFGMPGKLLVYNTLAVLSLNTLISWVVCELTLGAVDNHSHNQVNDVDEDLGADEALPEVHSTWRLVSASSSYGQLGF